MTVERLAYSPDEVAQALGVGRDTIYKAVANGTIPSLRVSPKRICIPRSWLERALAAADPAPAVSPSVAPAADGLDGAADSAHFEKSG